MSSQHWCLVQFVESNRAKPSVGVLADGKVSREPEVLSGLTLLEVLDRWEEFTPLLQNLQLSALEVAPDVKVVAPLTYPRKVLCAGANYYGHAKEMGTKRPDPDAEPFFFLKPPTTTVVGASEDVRLPNHADVDWEAELAVVIGTQHRRARGPGARGRLCRGQRPFRAGTVPTEGRGLPGVRLGLVPAQGVDGSCPLGPGVVPSWQIGDPHDLTLRLAVNGEVKQEASTADMVITVPRLIAAASRVLTLEPGDVILTGTPAGVGMPHKTFLNVGDLVVTEIDGIGRLENRMVAV